jgi:predicted RNase H-like HicB family nuclease
MFKYSVSLKWSDKDEGYIAFVPELPGLSAFGNTPKEAIAELEIAGEAYLESLREAGENIPAPEKYMPYSGQIRLRMPKTLHAKLAQSALEENVSLNTYLISLLAAGRGEKETIKLIRGCIASTLMNQPIIIYQTEAKVEAIKHSIQPPGFLPFSTATGDATNKEIRSIN